MPSGADSPAISRNAPRFLAAHFRPTRRPLTASWLFFWGISSRSNLALSFQQANEAVTARSILAGKKASCHKAPVSDCIIFLAAPGKVDLASG